LVWIVSHLPFALIILLHTVHHFWHGTAPKWSQAIERENFRVTMVTAPIRGAVSESDRATHVQVRAKAHILHHIKTRTKLVFADLVFRQLPIIIPLKRQGPLPKHPTGTPSIQLLASPQGEGQVTTLIDLPYHRLARIDRQRRLDYQQRLKRRAIPMPDGGG